MKTIRPTYTFYDNYIKEPTKEKRREKRHAWDERK